MSRTTRLAGVFLAVGSAYSLFPGAAIANNLGITLTFALSPGNSAALTSHFEIVPEPATAALPALGLVGLAAARRR